MNTIEKILEQTPHCESCGRYYTEQIAALRQRDEEIATLKANLAEAEKRNLPEFVASENAKYEKARWRKSNDD